MNKILKKYFDDIYNAGRMSHAFLICNTTYNNQKEDINQILSDYFFDKKEINENNSDIILIEPENGKIVKDKILSLQEQLKTKSQINKNRVYIIDGAEKMNDYAANSLLKFLEEPEEDIYGIIITENLNQVLPTIKSRCQILLIKESNDLDLKNIDPEIIDKTIKLIDLIENKKINSEAYLYEIINKKEEKELTKNIVKIMKYIYYETVKRNFGQINNEYDQFNDIFNLIIEKNTEKNIINKLIVINKCENMLEYNMNINLFLDRLIIEMDGGQK